MELISPIIPRRARIWNSVDVQQEPGEEIPLKSRITNT
jgi:hypothetical protein